MKMNTKMTHTPAWARLSAPAALLLAALGAHAAATIEIQNRDPVGIGFNDPTPVAPVGGNPGTTLGEQRLFVYQHVANLWAAAIDSPVKITVSAGWEALSCTATSATLGSASAWNGWRDFPNAPKANTWYPQALANKLANVGQSLADYYGQPDDGTGYGNVDIKTQFNINLGQPTCLAGSPFYLGIDGNLPVGQVNFAVTLLHELGHGLGFALFTTSSATGAQFDNRPSVWEEFMVDNTTGKAWTQMTNAERVASAINFRQLAWVGPNSVAGVPTTLTPGVTPVPSLAIGGPAAGSAAGNKGFGTAAFGPQLFSPVSADVMPVAQSTTAAGVTGRACGPLTPIDALAVRGRIALIDRGDCGFVVKVKNAQNAGAIGVLIGNVLTTQTVGVMGGADPTITIPSMLISLNDNNALKTALARRSRTASGVTGTLATVLSGGSYIGTDALNRPLLFTPNPRIAGSSVSHWDTFMARNQLMEPNINNDLTFNLVPPFDLTVPLLKDLGW